MFLRAGTGSEGTCRLRSESQVGRDVVSQTHHDIQRVYVSGKGMMTASYVLFRPTSSIYASHRYFAGRIECRIRLPEGLASN